MISNGWGFQRVPIHGGACLPPSRVLPSFARLETTSEIDFENGQLKALPLFDDLNKGSVG